MILVDFSKFVFRVIVMVVYRLFDFILFKLVDWERFVIFYCCYLGFLGVLDVGCED